MKDLSKTVSLQRCTSYDDDLVYNAVKMALDDLGGIERMIKPGMKVALKPNLLLPIKPESCATTHPSVVGAVGRLVIEAGGDPIVVESPGGLYNKSVLKALYKSCGIFDVCKKYSIKLNYSTETMRKSADCLGRKRSFSILKPLDDADFIINISKLKTHGMMVFTGAVKNMFGAIAGIEKATHHMNMPDYTVFADNIIDICETTKPDLSIMDGITSMEGAGPSAGTPKQLDAIIASQSPYLVDKAAHDIINLAVEDSYILSQAVSRGIDLDYDNAGISVADLFSDNFSIPYKKTLGGKKNWFFGSWLMTHSKSKPIVDSDICIGCAICKNNCPAKVIQMKNNVPDFDYKGCIRCYCCQELCPKHAISIKEPLIMKLIKKNRN